MQSPSEKKPLRGVFVLVRLLPPLIRCFRSGTLATPTTSALVRNLVCLDEALVSFRGFVFLFFFFSKQTRCSHWFPDTKNENVGTLEWMAP
jgi:hypothetical protein